MERLNRFIISFMLMNVIGIGYGHSQVLGGLLNDDVYKSKVKLVGEFFERFNGAEFRPDIKQSQKDARLKNLILLFNAKMFKSFTDPAYLEAEKFAQKVLGEKIKIAFNDTTWVAKAECHGTLKGKPIDFTLYLNVEHRHDELYKWVIAKAQGNVFKLSPSLQKETIMLMPDDHETNFMSLRRITTEKDDYILNYKQKQFEIDQTSVFYTYVYSGLLNIEYVKNLSFSFYQVPGYIFEISYFERENLNSGWLISSLRKITDEEKLHDLNEIYSK